MTGEDVLAFIRSDEGRRAARDYLSAGLRRDAQIALRLARLDQLRKKRAENTAAIRAGEDEVRRAYGRLRQTQQGILAAIRRVPDEICRQVLEARYVQGLPFFRIAMELHYDERQIYRIHRKGLEHVAAQIARGQAGPPPDDPAAIGGASFPVIPQRKAAYPVAWTGI